MARRKKQEGAEPSKPAAGLPIKNMRDSSVAMNGVMWGPYGTTTISEEDQKNSELMARVARGIEIGLLQKA